MRVELLNKEYIKDLYENHGLFACGCYNTPDKYAEKVGESCQADKHMSGSRCEYFKFRIYDVDRGSAEQMLRHEVGVKVPIEDQDNYYFGARRFPLWRNILRLSPRSDREPSAVAFP